MIVDQIVEANRWLYPPLPLAAMALYVVAYVVSRRHPTSTTWPVLSRRRDLEAEVAAWSLDDHETEVRWLDHPALSKREIIAAAGERCWCYRGQDIHAEGWPLYFTRDETVTGVLEAEQAQRAELQERVAVPGEDVAPPAPPPPTVGRLLNAVVIFGSVTFLPVALLLIPAVREIPPAVPALGVIALAGAMPFAVAVVRMRRVLLQHRETAHRDRALRLHPEGTPEPPP